MLFSIFSIVCILLALVVAYYGVRTLGKFAWFFGWLRGMVGILLIAFAVVFVMAGLDMMSYRQLTVDRPLLTISFTQVEQQHFKANLNFIEDNVEQEYDVHGDQWQIDARVIRWKGYIQIFGAKPGYRLGRLSGRYYSLEDERRNTRSVHALEESEYGLDLWAWVRDNGRFLPLFDAVYGSATFLPMADGAIFQVALSNSGLVAKPLNDSAERAIEHWQ